MGNKMHLSTVTVVFALAITGCTDGTANKTNNNPPAGDSASTAKAAPVSYQTDNPQGNINPRPSTDGDTLVQPKPTPIFTQASKMYLPVESRFIDQGEMLIDAAGEALQSRKFDSIARNFENDSAKDKNALELTNLYRQSIKKQLGPTGDLVSLSCGLSLCIGALRTQTPANYDAWTQKFFADKSTPSFSFADSVLKLADNYYEGRFLFSTDPAANAISGKSTLRVKKP